MHASCMQAGLANRPPRFCWSQHACKLHAGGPGAGAAGRRAQGACRARLRAGSGRYPCAHVRRPRPGQEPAAAGAPALLFNMSACAAPSLVRFIIAGSSRSRPHVTIRMLGVGRSMLGHQSVTVRACAPRCSSRPFSRALGLSSRCSALGSGGGRGGAARLVRLRHRIQRGGADRGGSARRANR